MFEGQCGLGAQGLGHHASNFSVISCDHKESHRRRRRWNQKQYVSPSDTLFTSVKVASSCNGIRLNVFYQFLSV